MWCLYMTILLIAGFAQSMKGQEFTDSALTEGERICFSHCAAAGSVMVEACLSCEWRHVISLATPSSYQYPEPSLWTNTTASFVGYHVEGTNLHARIPVLQGSASCSLPEEGGSLSQRDKHEALTGNCRRQVVGSFRPTGDGLVFLSCVPMRVGSVVSNSSWLSGL